MCGVEAGFASADNPDRRIGFDDLAEVVGCGRPDAFAGDRQWRVRLDLEAERLDQSLGLDQSRLSGRVLQSHLNPAVGLLVRHIGPTEALVDIDLSGHDVQAVLQVVEDFRLACQVTAFLAQRPFDVARREQLIRLVQSHIVVRVDPHPTDAWPPIDEHHLVVAAQILGSSDKRVEAGDTGAEDADLALIGVL